ncbi:MAG: hypothetical protein ACLFU8_02020 [Anaerolineales bacterium]
MQERKLKFGIGLGVLVGLMLLASYSLVVAAPTLPPRPDPTATAIVVPGGGDAEPGSIVLQVAVPADESRPPADLWSEVEWVDAQGDWHVVEGWRAPLERGYRRSWGVLPRDFGKGPFRWALYEGSEGELLDVSAPFHLPGSRSESVGSVIALLP